MIAIVTFLGSLSGFLLVSWIALRSRFDGTSGRVVAITGALSLVSVLALLLALTTSTALQLGGLVVAITDAAVCLRIHERGSTNAKT